MNSFSFLDREKNVKKMTEKVFDLVIIGGGINGAGLAREAASRGLTVALVEANDFSFGTSSRSSKLIHGGIRYLENLEFGLVFEALSERKKLLELAPHLVKPLRFILPLYKDSRVSYFKMGMGMLLYDLLSFFSAPRMHERLDAKQTKDRITGVKTSDLVGAFVYSDAYMDDDRLVLETLRSANEFGAVTSNYCEVKRLQQDEFKNVQFLEVFDQISNSHFELKGKHFVGTLGPWTDLFGCVLNNTWKKVLRPTKGIHLIFSKDKIPFNDGVVMAADKEERIVFVIPREDMVVVGTTDTDFQGNPTEVKVEKKDVDYILNILNEYFPDLEITDQDIISSYAGIRPLYDDGAKTEGKTSREHEIICVGSNLFFLVGGKYTTYRLVARDLMKSIERHMSIDELSRLEPSKTDLSMNPLADENNYFRSQMLVSNWAKQLNWPLEDLKEIINRHGLEAYKILTSMKYQYKKTRWSFEAFHSIHYTMCMNLIDFYTRRSGLFLSHKDHGISFLPEISEVFSGELSWDLATLKEQETKLSFYIKMENSWRKNNDEDK